ncbi:MULTISPECIES: SDR family oxidoreductase [Asticcacaulis]|uniref:SDR family oxidoreductase n=1 Tax=Asticcacaulis TaxID=76890 RepID=UPI001AE3CDAE|nr:MULTISPECIES: SDR family oxidoreductase [Asticcacaulis]MBP2160289.1 NAD(P)-dependent dehydrogenase (short-subunit alcohol dehydrogenase family) [Asticcacaulis solisilvae]MDR6801408.1 NAD(P)-dependent dehydrogenase (short-subunit alcohol dehydrogenase family) [Asticcacaulis sp. BE141]
MDSVLVLLGAGAIGQAVARRVAGDRHVVVADVKPDTAGAAAEALRAAGLRASTARVDVASRDSVLEVVDTASTIGNITGLVHAAGVSPSQASVERILEVDLYGTAVVLEEFGHVIAPGGSAVVIASQSGHRLEALSAEQNRGLAVTPAAQLLALPFLRPEAIRDELHAYQLSKRGNSLRVMAEAARWGTFGARVNAISPGIILTPLGEDELNGPRGEGYRRMIALSPARRAGTPEEVANVAALLMGPEGGFITGSDVLMDGGVTASYFYGALKDG